MDKVRPVAPDPSAAPPGRAPDCSAGAACWASARLPPCGTRPGAGDETPLVERSGSKGLIPSAQGNQGRGARGDTTAGKPMPVHFPEDLLRRHHLYVARTPAWASPPSCTT